MTSCKPVSCSGRTLHHGVSKYFLSCPVSVSSGLKNPISAATITWNRGTAKAHSHCYSTWEKQLPKNFKFILIRVLSQITYTVVLHAISCRRKHKKIYCNLRARLHSHSQGTPVYSAHTAEAKRTHYQEFQQTIRKWQSRHSETSAPIVTAAHATNGQQCC